MLCQFPESFVWGAATAAQIEGYDLFLHPLFLGGCSKALTDYLDKNDITPPIEQADIEIICRKLDFYGLNLYNELYDNADEQQKAAEGGEEFNLMSDINAANVVFSSSMPLWQVPTGTYKQFGVSLAELQLHVRPYGKIGRYLFEQMAALNNALADLPYWPHGETWCLGDEGVICALLEDRERRGGYTEIPAPRIGADMRYLPGDPTRKIRVYHTMDVRLDLEDFYAKLQINYPKGDD